jgi:DNA-binding GntR family transcriptional regulator
MSKCEDGKPASQDVAAHLREEIATGTLCPGQRLIEVQLCERFSATRSRVREALRRLEQDRLVKIIPNVGANVAELSERDIEHSYDLMSVLEGLAVRVGTPFVTAPRLEMMEALIARMEATNELSEFHGPNDEFHVLLACLSENDRLIAYTDNLRVHLRRFGIRALSNPLQMAASKTEHRKIFEAIRDLKAAKAEMLVRKHYLQAKTRLIKGIHRSL